jgi:hypothetical protein
MYPACGGFYTLMMKLDQTLLSVSSDLFVNLAAGWIGVVIIAPNFSGATGFKRIVILISDILAATLCVIFAIVLRKL